MALSRKVKTALAITALLLILFAIWLGVSIHRSATELTVVCYESPTAVTQPIRIGGYYGYYGITHMITDDPGEETAQTVFFRF